MTMSKIIDRVNSEFCFAREFKSELMVLVAKAYSKLTEIEQNDLYCTLGNRLLSLSDRYRICKSVCEEAIERSSNRNTSTNSYAAAIGYIQMSDMFGSDKTRCIESVGRYKSYITDIVAECIRHTVNSDMFGSDIYRIVDVICEHANQIDRSTAEIIINIVNSDNFGSDNLRSIKRLFAAPKPSATSTPINTYSGRPKTTTGNSTIDLICDAIDIANFLGKL